MEIMQYWTRTKQRYSMTVGTLMMSEPNNSPYILNIWYYKILNFCSNIWKSVPQITMNLSNDYFTSIKWVLMLCITFVELTSGIFFLQFSAQNELKIVRQWHHQHTNLHIGLNVPQNILWKSAKLQNFITSLFFVQFSLNFHHSVRIFSSISIEINKNLDWISPLMEVSFGL